MKQKNLVVFGLQEDPNCSTKKSQNEVDLKLLNQGILQNCPVKCSFTVRLGRLNNGKCCPIKLFFHSPIERDAASFLARKSLEKQLWNNSFLVLHTNADTLSNKVEELQSLMSVHKPHVVVITESLPKNCAHPETYFQQVEGYTLLVNVVY